MRRIWLCCCLGALVYVGGCDDMHNQVAVQPLEAPRLSAPAVAVPVSGKERLEFGQVLQNPQADTAESRQRGERLYAINCTPCHGDQETYPSPAGSLFEPPPPNLRDGHLAAYDESTLYQMFSLGFGRMPPFQDRLNSTDRWHLVNFLRSNN